MNVTGEPGQKGFGVAVIDTPAGRPIVPVMVIVFDVAGLFVIQSGSEEVRMQLTRSPFKGE